jgi:hypothetical protein
MARKSKVSPAKGRGRAAKRVLAPRGRGRAAKRVLAFRAEVLQQLEACVVFRSPRFRAEDIEALAHWLELYERRPWTKAGRQFWLVQLRAAR